MFPFLFVVIMYCDYGSFFLSAPVFFLLFGHPSRRKESLAALKRLGELFRKEEILLSVMSQFSPLPGAEPPLHRRITTFEQQSVTSFAEELGFEGYFQERSSASEEYIPPFDLSGV